MNHLIGVLNYGGRVSDELDARIIKALLLRLFNDEVLDKENNNKENIY